MNCCLVVPPLPDFAITFLDWPANSKRMARPSLEEQLGSSLGESLKFAIMKLSCAPEVKKQQQQLIHRQGEHRLLMETGDTRGVIDCSSLSPHRRVGRGKLWG